MNTPAPRGPGMIFARTCFFSPVWLYYTQKKQNGVWLLRFEWDEQKNALNKAKHGISFETAALVFYDENYIEMYDFEHSLDEDRYIAIGRV